MYKFAIIVNGTVSNIIESDSPETVNILKQYNETVVVINKPEVEIGYLWDGSKLYKNPILQEKENKSLERQMYELQEQKNKSYEELKAKENLTEEEKITLNMLNLEM